MHFVRYEKKITFYIIHNNPQLFQGIYIYLCNTTGFINAKVTTLFFHKWELYHIYATEPNTLERITLNDNIAFR